jgi:abortive infection protein
MKAADTGIESVSLNEEKIPVETLERLYKFLKAITEFDDKSNEILSNDEAEKVIYNLVFTHSGEINSILTLSEESAGTLAWLSTAPTLLQTLREGSVLIADELDSSLHQKLIEMIIKCFTDPSINQHGAQLIFTIHNTNIIEHMDDLSLDTKSIWFMEKNQNGESSLYSLADFPNHSDANYERRYLSGRYGALPYLSPAILRGLVTTHTLEAAHESNSESPSPA